MTVPIDGENMGTLANRLRDTLCFAWNFDPTRNGVAQWQTDTRAKMRAALGLGLSLVPAAKNLASWSEDGLEGRHIRLTSSNGEQADAYLLQPQRARPAPAVLLLHDHGSQFAIGKEKMIRRPDEHPTVAAETDAWATRLYGGRHVGNELARRGYTVLAVDALGWGSRRGNGYEGQQALAANLMQFGVSLASVLLREDMEALAFLHRLPGVDQTRIAVLGFSMGGSRAWQLAALADEVKACVAGGWMATLHGLMQPGHNQLRGQSAFYMLHPQIAGKLDYPHFAGLAAPKPMLVFSGSDDGHFPVPTASEAHRQMRDIWSAAGARDQIDTRILSGTAHAFPVAMQDQAIDWLNRTLA
jgi:dienelactone hydrolase